MASEAVVPSIVGKLGDLLIQEAQLLSEVREEVEWIKHELEWMQCFLDGANSIQNTNALVKKWVSDIRDCSFEIEDVIETFVYSQRRRHGLVGRVVRYISQLKTGHKVAKQIEQIKEKISDISRRRETYGIRDINEGRQEASSWIRDLEGRRRDSVMFEEPQLVGQHEEFKTVRDQLLTEEQRRRVISIFGIGGSGKTALAKKILNDVKDHFDCHALVYVSQQCQIKDVLVCIIKGVAGHSTPKDIEKMDVVDLGRMLCDDYLRRKRYLLVIDDIWTTKAWDSLILRLPDDGNRSRVLVTTRIRDVALHADPSGHHQEMRLLNDHESWELFMKKIFPGKDPLPDCPSELKETGEKILEKCGGLPLPILVLGGLLATKEQTIREWSNVLASVPRHLKERNELCMKILALSYWDLPCYLKPCFLYFGLFPEDYEISSGKMIRLWIAEGFIKQEGNNVIEDVAEEYLEELVRRSMIQVASKRSNGSIRKCRIHDLLRELSIAQARGNNFFALQDDDDTSSSRRLAVHRSIDGDETKNHSIETLRSILYFLDSEDEDGELKLQNTSCKLLRVMNIESKEVSCVPIPKEVREFVHLKFLEFSSKYFFTSISPSIGNLSRLQTLKVYRCKYCTCKLLPNTIWNLKELRHLRIDLDIMGPPRLSNLRKLQSLTLNAGSWIEEGLGKLTNLRKLKIFNDVGLYHDTLPYCIEKLQNLRALVLSENENPIPPFRPFTQDLYKIAFGGRIKELPKMPPNLVQLILFATELKQDAIFTLEKLQHLKNLELHVKSYLSKQMICSPGGFPRLESLVFASCPLEEWIVEEGGFPRLEFLELSSLPLEEWIFEEGAMISLKSVQLYGMSKLKTETLPERVCVLLKWRSGA